MYIKIIADIENGFIEIDKLTREQLDNKEIVLALIQKDATKFPYISNRLKGDKEVALVAVEKHKYNFSQVSTQLKNDEEVALVALKVSSDNFYDVSEQLQNDKDFILKVIREEVNVFGLLCDQLKDDEDVVLVAIKCFPSNFQYVSSRLKTEVFEVLTERNKKEVDSIIKPENNGENKAGNILINTAGTPRKTRTADALRKIRTASLLEEVYKICENNNWEKLPSLSEVNAIVGVNHNSNFYQSYGMRFPDIKEALAKLYIERHPDALPSVLEKALRRIQPKVTREALIEHAYRIWENNNWKKIPSLSELSAIGGVNHNSNFYQRYGMSLSDIKEVLVKLYIERHPE